MAVWQWWIFPVPRVRVHEFELSSGFDNGSDEFDSITWWVDEPLDRYVRFFDDRLVRDNRPYAKDQISWGNVDKNDVSIGIDGKMLEYISIRIDARESAELLSITIDLTNAYDLWIYDFNAEIFISSDPGQIHNAFKNSKAVQFSAEPITFFEDSKYLDDINRKNKAKLGIK
jgi:hypothetical protein